MEEEKKTEEQSKTEEPKETKTEEKVETFSREYVEELRKENAKYRTEKKTLEEQMEAEKKAKLEEENNFKELYETEKAAREALSAELEETKPYKEKLTEYEQKRRDVLIADLPDEYKAIGEKLDLEGLEEYVKLHSKQKAANHDNGFGSGDDKLTDKDKEDAKAKGLSEEAYKRYKETKLKLNPTK